jgi:hypothetical protein
MYSGYGRRISVSPSFKMLVAHSQKSSDPSKGEAGNPVPTRQVFETQIITTQLGTGILANTKETETILVLKVETTDFGNENLGNAPPYYLEDQIQIFGKSYMLEDRLTALKAGNYFGRAEGESGGSKFDVAADLNSVINDMKIGLTSTLDPNNLNHLHIKSSGVLDELFIKVYSLSYLLLAGDPPFILEDKDGNVLYDPTLTEGGSYINLLQNKSFSPMEIS